MRWSSWTNSRDDAAFSVEKYGNEALGDRRLATPAECLLTRGEQQRPHWYLEIFVSGGFSAWLSWRDASSRMTCPEGGTCRGRRGGSYPDCLHFAEGHSFRFWRALALVRNATRRSYSRPFTVSVATVRPCSGKTGPCAVFEEAQTRGGTVAKETPRFTRCPWLTVDEPRTGETFDIHASILRYSSGAKKVHVSA
jgi:hypothetical protein